MERFWYLCMGLAMCSKVKPTSEQPKAPPARTARRDRIPPGVIAPEQEEEKQGDQKEEASVICADSEESSDEQGGSPQDITCTPLSEDGHQHLQDFESVPRRWPLARLSTLVEMRGSPG